MSELKNPFIRCIIHGVEADAEKFHDLYIMPMTKQGYVIAKHHKERWRNNPKSKIFVFTWELKPPQGSAP